VCKKLKITLIELHHERIDNILMNLKNKIFVYKQHVVFYISERALYSFEILGRGNKPKTINQTNIVWKI
jgi:hypothetical protein